jgi:hypothetical protein
VESGEVGDGGDYRAPGGLLVPGNNESVLYPLLEASQVGGEFSRKPLIGKLLDASIRGRR